MKQPIPRLKNHRDEWAHQDDRGRDLCAIESDHFMQTIADRAISHLIVVLNVAKESVLRHVRCGFAVKSFAVI